MGCGVGAGCLVSRCPLPAGLAALPQRQAQQHVDPQTIEAWQSAQDKLMRDLNGAQYQGMRCRELGLVR